MDGACTQPAHQCRLASWGIVSATTGDVVALGHLPGVTQTIDRAELTALVSTMLWTTGADLCAWSDSLSNINIAEYIQNDGVIPSHVENYDLWLQFHEALQLREGCSTEFRWIPSHVNDSQAGDPFESWVFKWNNIVDELVSKWNINRPLGFLEQHAALDRTLNWWIERSKQSKSSELACAEQPWSLLCIDVDSSDEGTMDEGLLEDLLPSNWNVRCRQSTGKTPGKFVESLLQWLCAAEQAGNCPIRVSDLEIVFVLLGDPSFMFPFQMDGSTAWTLQRLDALFQTPTLGMLLRPTQDALQKNFHFFFQRGHATWPGQVDLNIITLRCCTVMLCTADDPTVTSYIYMWRGPFGFISFLAPTVIISPPRSNRYIGAILKNKSLWLRNNFSMMNKSAWWEGAGGAANFWSFSSSHSPRKHSASQANCLDSACAHTGLVLKVEAGDRKWVPLEVRVEVKKVSDQQNSKLCEWKDGTALNRNGNQQFKLVWHRYTWVIYPCRHGMLAKSFVGQRFSNPLCPPFMFEKPSRRNQKPGPVQEGCTHTHSKTSWIEVSQTMLVASLIENASSTSVQGESTGGLNSFHGRQHHQSGD